MRARPSRRSRAVVAAGSALALSAGSAARAAGPSTCRPNPLVAPALEQYDRLEFEPAARTLQRSLQLPRNCRRDLVAIHRLRGFIEAIREDREACQRTFEMLLALEPEHRLGPAPPKVQACFEAAVAVPPRRRRVVLNHAPPPGAEPLTPLVLELELEDPLRMVDQVQVWHRRSGARAYTRVSALAGRPVVLPASALPAGRPYELEYFLRAADRWGGVIAELGSAEAPFAIRVEALPDEGGLLTKWWFWTAVGAAAVGAAAATTMALDGDDRLRPVRFVDGGVRE